MQYLKKIITLWRTDYSFKTFLGAGGSFLAALVFAFYNAYLGVRHGSVWHGSICVYYMLLSVIRGSLLAVEDRIYKKNLEQGKKIRQKTFYITAVLFLLINVALVVPISLLVELKKPVSMGMIPAIAVAAYTTYKVALATVNFRRKNKSDHLFVKELRAVGLVDALLSILVLQNTLISVNNTDNDSNSMLVLSAVIGAILLLVIITISVSNLVDGIKELKKES